MILTHSKVAEDEKLYALLAKKFAPKCGYCALMRASDPWRASALAVVWASHFLFVARKWSVRHNKQHLEWIHELQ
jgi:hypothetical protein